MPRIAEQRPIDTSDRFRVGPRFHFRPESDWYTLIQRLTPDPRHNMDQMAAFACERLQADGCLFLNAAPSPDGSAIQAHVGLTSAAALELAAVQGAAQLRLEDRTGALAVEAAEDAPWFLGVAQRLGVKSALFCPIMLGMEKVGLLVIVFRSPRLFSPGDVSEAEAVANAVALENLRWARARTDEVKHRDSLRQVLAQLERARSTRKTLRARIRVLEADQRRALKEKEDLQLAIGNLHRKHSAETAESDQRTLRRIRALVETPLAKLRDSGLSPRQARWLDVIAKNLQPVPAPFETHFSSEYHQLTPTEIKVATLIKQNQTNKEIGEMLDISTRTVEVHRNNIRRKFGIRNKNVNLRTHLLTLE